MTLVGEAQDDRGCSAGFGIRRSRDTEARNAKAGSDFRQAGRAAGKQTGRECFIGRRGQQRHVERRRTANDVASSRLERELAASFH